MSQEKKFKKIQDGIEEQRMAAMSLFCECEEAMEKMPMAQLLGKRGIELAELMDALLLAERALRRAGEQMESVGKAG